MMMEKAALRSGAPATIEPRGGSRVSAVPKSATPQPKTKHLLRQAAKLNFERDLAWHRASRRSASPQCVSDREVRTGPVGSGIEKERRHRGLHAPSPRWLVTCDRAAPVALVR